MADYYVDFYEGDDANDGLTATTAWASLTKLETEMLTPGVDSGDTVYFQPGDTHTWDAAAEGTLFWEDGITFRTTVPGETVEIIGTGTDPFRIREPGCTFIDIVFNGSTSGSCIDTATPSASTVTMLRCTVKNAAGIGLQQQSGASTTIDSVFDLKDCTFSDNGTNGANLTGCHESTIDNCTFNGNGTVGLRIQSSGPNVIVRDVTAFDNGSNGIGIATPQAGGGSEVVEGCVVYENATITDDTSGIKTFSDGTIIRYNTCYDNGLTGGTIDHGIQVEVGATNCEVYYNLCYGNQVAGISFTGTGHTISNNTCYDNGETGIATFDTGITNCTVQNNILSGNATYSFRSHGTVTITNLTMNHNLHWGDNGAATIRYDGTNYATLAAFVAVETTKETRGKEADPRFRSPSFFDFGLKYTSPAIWGALDIGLTRDHAGIEVPASIAASMGALEFNQSMRTAY